jgi:predicted metal-dependent phosphoesterase TrpH
MGKIDDLTTVLEEMKKINLGRHASNYPLITEVWFPELINKTRKIGGDSLLFTAMLENLLHEVMSSLKGGEVSENSLDLHVHAKLTRSIQLRNSDIDHAINTAHRKGLRGIAITEHLDRAMDFIQMMGEPHYAQYQTGNNPGLLIVPGCEVRIAQGKCDMVVLASTMEAIRQLDREAGGARDGYHITQGYTPPFQELVDLAGEINRKYGPVALIGAHIFRKGQMLCDPSTYEDRAGIDLRMVDAIETTVNDTEFAEPALAKRDILGKPMVYSSDAHLPLQIGTGHTQFYGDIKSPEDVVMAVKEGRFRKIESPSEISSSAKDLLMFCALYKEAYRIAHMRTE